MVQIFGCVTWTRLLVYNIKTDNFYEDITGDAEARSDMSGNSYSHPLPMGVSRKVIGFMKDELDRRIMTKFMALRPRLCTYKTLSGGGDKKCKGVKKCVVKKTLDFEDYKQCLFAGQNVFQKQLLFQNKLHEVYTIEVNKLALSRDNDK